MQTHQEPPEAQPARPTGIDPGAKAPGQQPEQGCVMRDAIIERELNEHTVAAVWKYLKTIAWIHLEGLLAEVPAE
jgi:hypothetical protein